MPSSPLPEGARVEIRLEDPASDVPEGLRAEFAAWDRAGANALDLVDCLAREGVVEGT